ncbi:MAG: porin family protein [Candidatus Saccharimonadaceae bacterium]
MKKNRLLVLAFIVAFSTIATTSFAQLRFGIKGEVGVNNPTFSEKVIEIDNLNSFKIGPTVEMMFPGLNFGIEGSVLYNNNKMDVTYMSGTDNEKIEITNHFIDIPVNAKVKFGLIAPLKIYAAAGPYAKVRIGGDDLTFKNVTDEFKAKSFEAGVNLGVGVELFNKLAVGANYGIKMTDNYSTDQPQWEDALNNKKGLWSLAATFYF